MSETIAVASLLGAVDALPASAAGAFVVSGGDGRQIGALLAEGNRVCWAAIAGHRQRLRDLLAISPSTAVRQHTVESLIRLDGCAGTTAWVPHRNASYHPRTTFAAVELLAAVGAELYTLEADGARELDELVSDRAIGASFVVGDDGDAVLVHAIGGERVPMRAIGELGAWAIAALDATRGFSAAAIARTLATTRTRATLAWRARRRLVQTLVIEDPSALARAVADLDRRGYPAVLSTRVPGAPIADAGVVPVRRTATP